MMVFMSLFAVWIGQFCRDVIRGENTKLPSRTKTNLPTDREQCTESNVLTGRLLILGRLAETQDWLNTNERPRAVISGITFLNIID